MRKTCRILIIFAALWFTFAPQNSYAQSSLPPEVRELAREARERRAEIIADQLERIEEEAENQNFRERNKRQRQEARKRRSPETNRARRDEIRHNRQLRQELRRLE